jgi:hypothetical protein
VTLLREALQVAGVEEQRTVTAVRELVVYDFCSDRSPGMEPTFAQRLLP